jgi:glutathione S-transferase
VHTPGAVEQLFFPRARGLRRRLLGRAARRGVRRRFGLSAERERRDEVEVRRLAAIAADRLGDRAFLVGDRLSVADVTLAAMTAPLRAAAPVVREDGAVTKVLAWGEGILGPALRDLYRLPS